MPSSSSIPEDAIWRGCASSFRAPINKDDQRAAEVYVQFLNKFNSGAVVYRSGSREHDILHRLFRWDLTPHEKVFQNGFRAVRRRQQDTSSNTPPNDIYFNLDHYVHHHLDFGRPLDSTTPASHTFIGTTCNSGWHPKIDDDDAAASAAINPLEVYRYEIYAPGGIWVSQTLSDSYCYPGHDKVAFVAGIAPQYIYSVQRFRLTFDSNTRHTKVKRIDTVLTINSNFNPQASGKIQMPTRYYLDENNTQLYLNICYYPPPAASSDEEKKQHSSDDQAANYINAAFRSSIENEAYIFMKDKYVLVDYAGLVTADDHDKLKWGPWHIDQGYPSLGDTVFAEHGIDCAFRSHDGTKAFIFCGNLCAHIDYAPHSLNDKIIKGPITIANMFPFLKNTAFENGVDAALESTIAYEAYLFKGDRYARINYSSDNPHLIVSPLISYGLPCLKNTIFEGGFGAAFASHKTSKAEAYLFKGDTYTCINFEPGTFNSYIVGGIKKILPHWSSLNGILPPENHGLDSHNHIEFDDPDHDHDKIRDHQLQKLPRRTYPSKIIYMFLCIFVCVSVYGYFKYRSMI